MARKTYRAVDLAEKNAPKGRAFCGYEAENTTKTCPRLAVGFGTRNQVGVQDVYWYSCMDHLHRNEVHFRLTLKGPTDFYWPPASDGDTHGWPTQLPNPF